MKYQIIADSSCDVYDDYLATTSDVRFSTVPLSIGIGEEEIIDDAPDSASRILTALASFKDKTRSACPSPQAFLEEYGKAEYTFVLTITSKLSGCFNSATLAKEMSADPSKIFVIDSMMTSGGLVLMTDQLVKFIKEGLDFEEICQKISDVRDRSHLLFVLQKFDNLVANGRMSKVAALIAKAAVIRPICRAEDGEIKIAKKLVGSKSALNKMVDMMKDEGYQGGSIVISHCVAEQEAFHVRDRIMETYGCKAENIRVLPMRGLCSYYAMEGGVIMCY